MDSYIYDVHIHTSETSSCGKVDAKTVVRVYKEAGYHGLVITDHYTRGYFESLRYNQWEDKVNQYLRGYHSALAEGRKLGLNVLLGMELRFDENESDYLIYGIDEDFLFRHRELYTLNIEKFSGMINGTTIQIYQAHPFRLTSVPANPAYLHGIEVYNGNPRQISNNSKAFEYAKKNGLKMISGSDFHLLSDLARGGIILSDTPPDSVEFAQILKNDNMIKFVIGKDEIEDFTETPFCHLSEKAEWI